MKRSCLLSAILGCLLFGQSPEQATPFRVKYVAEDVIYLDRGRSAGLSEGMKLTVKRYTTFPGSGPPEIIAELEVTAVAESSAACVIKSLQGEIEPGDPAYLSPQDVQIIQAMKSLQDGEKYAQVVTFTEGDPLDEEARAAVPRPPLPEINRARGRIGFEYNTIHQQGDGGYSSQVGLVFRGDLTRIGGSYWNLSGHWRGRMNARTRNQQAETITDLLNRTYHLTLSYHNPESPWHAGFGRLYLPWATSLETIDGGYFGRQFARHFTGGMFAGSTPDPTSWNYNPDRQLVGAFVNYTGGSFESLHATSTAGVAVSRIDWRPERQFMFFENGIFYKRYLSVYHNLEADQIKGKFQPGRNEVRVSRSFLTVRVQPVSFLSLDFSHNYFRDIPTFDPRLIGTGLVDNLLFQGGSAGFRLELPLHSTLYASFGRSSRTGDARRSLNQMYGVTKDDVLGTGLRADLRYSKFDSSFGHGTYRSLSLSREISDILRLEVQAGRQNYASPLSNQSRSHFISAVANWFFARRYFLGGGYTVYRSRLQNYDQLYVNLGCRF